MTKEQEKAIKVLEQYKRECIEEYKVELDDKDNIDQPRAFYLHQQIESVYIVLNMLKEKDAEIEKKDKQIEELIKYIDSNNYLDNEECQFQWDFKIEKCIGNGDCKECIKQYFERKVEDECKR